MRFAVAAIAATVCIAGAAAQQPRFDPVNSYSAFVEYSNDSSHILIGQSENRRLAAVGGGYNRRLWENRVVAWRYQLEVRPLVLLRNPERTLDLTNTVVGQPTVIPFQPGTVHQQDLLPRECKSSSGSGVYDVTMPGQPPVVVGTYTFTQTCGDSWTYGGAISPLGQRLNFRPHDRWQPFVAANAGFVAFSKVVPSDNATMFNFSFEFGAGVEFWARPQRSVALDLRYHHISNANRGNENPGVDSAVVKLAYTFGH